MAWRKKGDKFIVDCSYKKKRKTATVNTEEDAIAKDAELTLLLINGSKATPVESNVWTLKQAFDYTSRNVWKGIKSERSAVANALMCIDFFGGDTLLTEITTSRMNEFRESCKVPRTFNGRLEQPNIESTINRKIAALSRMLTTALENEKIPYLPHIPRKKEAKRKVNFLSDEQIESFHELFPQWGYDESLEIFTVMLDTGMRIGEVLALDTSHVNLKERAFFLSADMTKDEDDRTLPMTTRMYELFKGKKISGYETKYFKVTYRAFLSHWNKVRDAIGRKDDKRFTPHVCRRTCATRLLRKGARLEVVQEWLGHSNADMTRKYAEVSVNALKDVVGLLESAYWS